MDKILETRSATVVLPMQQQLHWSIACVSLERRMCHRGQFLILLNLNSSKFFYILGRSSNCQSVQTVWQLMLAHSLRELTSTVSPGSLMST